MKRIHIILVLALALSLLAGCAANQTENTATASGVEIQFSDGKITASSADGVEIDGTALTITDAGTDVLSGSSLRRMLTAASVCGNVTICGGKASNTACLFVYDIIYYWYVY